jgi:hypothetical protein
MPNSYYEKSFIETSDKNQQISLESVRIPFFQKRLLNVVNKSRIVPFLDPDDSIQRNNILTTAKNSALTVCFDVEQKYQNIINLAGYSSELFHLYDCCCLKSLDRNTSLRPNKRRDLNRRKKRLSETGEINYVISKGQDIDKFKFDHFFNLLKASYDQGRINTMWGIEKNKNLLKTILNFQDSLLFEMTLNKKPIAFAHCQLMSNSRLIYMIPSYDEDFSKYSPGMLLILNIMDYCIENNMILDLGKGSFGYKEQFDLNNYSLYSIFIFNNNIGKLMVEPIKLLLKLFIFLKRRKNKTCPYT